MQLEDSSAAIDLLAALSRRFFPSWDELCTGVLEAALQCLPGDDGFLARYEQGAEWMTLLASGHTFTQSFASRDSRQIPALRLDDEDAEFFHVSADSIDYAAQSWLNSSFPAANCLLAVPIPGPNATCYGVIGVLSQGQCNYTKTDVAILQLLGQRFAHAVEMQAEQDTQQRLQQRLELAKVNQQSLQMELQRIMRVKEDLRFLVNHDFRNALTGVQGFGEVLRDEVCTPAEVHAYATDIMISAARLERIMQDLLRFDQMPVASIEHALDRMDQQDIREHIMRRVRSSHLPHTDS